MLSKWLKPHGELAYAAARVVLGLSFSFHGWQKIFGVLSSGAGPVAGSQIWVGGLIELAGGTLVALGIATEYAALLCSGTMAVAYIQFHWKLQLGADFFPAINKGELALVYCFIFLLFGFYGSGKYSLDHFIRPKVSGA
jgi:putative oxidoreductase